MSIPIMNHYRGSWYWMLLAILKICNHQFGLPHYHVQSYNSVTFLSALLTAWGLFNNKLWKHSIWPHCLSISQSHKTIVISTRMRRNLIIIYKNRHMTFSASSDIKPLQTMASLSYQKRKLTWNNQLQKPTSVIFYRYT